MGSAGADPEVVIELVIGGFLLGLARRRRPGRPLPDWGARPEAGPDRAGGGRPSRAALAAGRPSRRAARPAHAGPGRGRPRVPRAGRPGRRRPAAGSGWWP